MFDGIDNFDYRLVEICKHHNPNLIPISLYQIFILKVNTIYYSTPKTTHNHSTAQASQLS